MEMSRCEWNAEAFFLRVPGQIRKAVGLRRMLSILCV